MSNNRIKQLEKREKINSADLDRLSKAVGEIRIYVNKQLTNFQIRIDAIKKQANDALYEVRAGRKILDTKIASVAKNANDALYEVRAGRKILEGKITTTDKKANDALYEVRTGRKILDGRIDNLIRNGAGNGNLPANIIDRINKASSDAAKALISVSQIPTIINKELLGIPRLIDGKIADIRKELNPKIDRKLDKDKLIAEIQQNSVTVGRIFEPYIRSQIKPYIDTTGTLQNAVGNLAKNVGDNINIDNRQNRDIDVAKTDIDLLKERIRKQEKVNEEGNKKLEDLLKLTIGIPLIIQKASETTTTNTINKLKPEIPPLAAQGFCRTLQPGGCSRKAFDDLGNSINANTNNKTNNLLNALNSGANAAQLTILNRIDGKLGEQLPGGVSGFLQNFLTRFNQVAQWLHLDRVLNVLIWWQTLHNAAMLSNNIVQTLASGISNVLTFIGIKDAEGNALNIGTILGQAYTDAIKTALGEETYNNLNKAWNAANRIYQSAANIAGLIQSIQQSILTALEVVGAGVARIANALKAAGQVFENAYAWMNPQPNFDNALFARLEQLQQTASNIELVTQTPLDIQSAVTGLKEEKRQMGEALKDGENALKGLGVIASETETIKAQESKISSIGVDLSGIDKVEADS
ncbi:hypothetical protein NIES4101_28880 [Calothrix sp. NIES-4101]|nr:hypothetical protein NIES4101_28880 [Calothrix sp. NIES-4101]